MQRSSRNPDEAPVGAPRRLFAHERAAYVAHLERLDPESRRLRFGAPVSPEIVAAHANRTFAGRALVFGWFEDGELRASAELHPMGGGWRRAEAAFSVERAYQSRGLGSRLFKAIILTARNRGVRTLVVTCLAQNKRMQAIARRFGAKLRFTIDEATGEITLTPPTGLSYLLEGLAEQHRVLAAYFDRLSGPHHSGA